MTGKENFGFAVRKYSDEDMEQVISLWGECNLLFPGNDPVKDIMLKVSFQPDLFLVGTAEDRIAATLMAGYDGHRGWLNYLGVLPQYQGKGFGQIIVHHAIGILNSLGCPKVNLQVRTGNSGVKDFYKKLGFTEHDVSSMQLRL